MLLLVANKNIKMSSNSQASSNFAFLKRRARGFTIDQAASTRANSRRRMYVEPENENSVPGDEPEGNDSMPKGESKDDDSVPGEEPEENDSVPGEESEDDDSVSGDKPEEDNSVPGDDSEDDDSVPGEEPEDENSVSGSEPGGDDSVLGDESEDNDSIPGDEPKNDDSVPEDEPEDNDSVPGEEFPSDAESEDNHTGLIEWEVSTREVITDTATQRARIAEAVAWLKAHPIKLPVTASRIFKCNSNSVTRAWSRATKEPNRNQRGETLYLGRQ